VARAPLKLLIDECLRSDRLFNAIRQFNDRNPSLRLDVVAVGDDGAPPRSADDATVLEWSIKSGRNIVTLDRETFIGRYYETVKREPAPALLVMKAGHSAGDMATWLAMCSYALTEDEATSQVHFGPV
jgi:hypothetical protein